MIIKSIDSIYRLYVFGAFLAFNVSSYTQRHELKILSPFMHHAKERKLLLFRHLAAKSRETARKKKRKNGRDFVHCGNVQYIDMFTDHIDTTNDNFAMCQTQ